MIPWFCWVFYPKLGSLVKLHLLWIRSWSENAGPWESWIGVAGTPRWRSWFLAWGLWPNPLGMGWLGFFLGGGKLGKKPGNIRVTTGYTLKMVIFLEEDIRFGNQDFRLPCYFSGVVKFPTGEDFWGHSSSELPGCFFAKLILFFGGCK